MTELRWGLSYQIGAKPCVSIPGGQTLTCPGAYKLRLHKARRFKSESIEDMAVARDDCRLKPIIGYSM